MCLLANVVFEDSMEDLCFVQLLINLATILLFVFMSTGLEMH